MCVCGCHGGGDIDLLFLFALDSKEHTLTLTPTLPNRNKYDTKIAALSGWMCWWTDYTPFPLIPTMRSSFCFQRDLCSVLYCTEMRFQTLELRNAYTMPYVVALTLLCLLFLVRNIIATARKSRRACSPWGW